MWRTRSASRSSEGCALPVFCTYPARTDGSGHHSYQPLHCPYSQTTRNYFISIITAKTQHMQLNIYIHYTWIDIIYADMLHTLFNLYDNWYNSISSLFVWPGGRDTARRNVLSWKTPGLEDPIHQALSPALQSQKGWMDLHLRGGRGLECGSVVSLMEQNQRWVRRSRRL